MSIAAVVNCNRSASSVSFSYVWKSFEETVHSVSEKHHLTKHLRGQITSRMQYDIGAAERNTSSKEECEESFFITNSSKSIAKSIRPYGGCYVKKSISRPVTALSLLPFRRLIRDFLCLKLEALNIEYRVSAVMKTADGMKTLTYPNLENPLWVFYRYHRPQWHGPMDLTIFILRLTACALLLPYPTGVLILKCLYHR